MKKKKEIGTHELKPKLDISTQRITDNINLLIEGLDLELSRVLKLQDKFNMNEKCKKLLLDYFDKINIIKATLLAN